VITHLHYDHAGNLGAFPNARFHLQDSEMIYATGRCMCHPRLRYPFEIEDVVTMVRRVYAGRVNFVDGDDEIAPGISLHHVPGHTRGLQCVRVETARGPVVLASDAAHFYANMERQNPFPILVDLAAMMESWRKLGRLAGDERRIVPGHDPLVMQRYPRFAVEGVEAVMLHENPTA
jgi:glyoxylase-like metal-dependent hydrolase (beta-lactamase superfamily II)